MAVIERIIGKISPTWALKRARAQAALSVMANIGFTGDSTYRSAQTNLRSMGTWLPQRGSAMAELDETTRSRMVSRSADSYRNNPIAHAVIKRNKTSVVGTGLRLQSRIDYKTLGISREEATEKQREIETLFRTWAGSPDECDLERTLDFYSLQALILISHLISGDVFALTPEVKYPGQVFFLKLQVIESDRVSNPNWGLDTKRRKGGVDLGRYGQPIAVNIMEDHPGDYYVGSKPYVWHRHLVFGRQTGRRRIFHTFDKDRPALYRGCPYLSPVMETLKQIGRYKDSELMAALIASFFTVFVKTQVPQGKPYGAAPLTSTSATTAGLETSALAADELLLGEGLINMLTPGDEIQIADPHRPNKDCKPFLDLQIREIGASLEVPFELMTQHFSASYSASRAALLEAWRYFLAKRAQLALQDCQPAYELLFDECVATGRFGAKGYSDPLRRAAWTRASWIGPSRGSIQELQAAKAATERMNNGTSNEAIECDELARDRDEVFAQRAYEIQTRQEAMITNEPAKTEPELAPLPG